MCRFHIRVVMGEAEMEREVGEEVEEEGVRGRLPRGPGARLALAVLGSRGQGTRRPRNLPCLRSLVKYVTSLFLASKSTNPIWPAKLTRKR